MAVGENWAANDQPFVSKELCKNSDLRDHDCVAKMIDKLMYFCYQLWPCSFDHFVPIIFVLNYDCVI